MNSLEIREFSQAIVNYINQSPFSMELKRLCLLDILRQVEEQATKEIRMEIEKRNFEKEQEGKVNGDAESIPEED